MSISADLPCAVPHERWAIDPLYSPDVEPGKLYVRFAATIEHIQEFDAELFKMPHSEALAMDPQSRILIEEVCMYHIRM